MVSCNILRYTDLMLSFDVHQMVIPPAPPAPGIYFHPSFLGFGELSGKAKYSGDADTISKGIVKTMGVNAMFQGTDTGFFNTHIGNPANVLLPIVILFSASKSVFHSSTVNINGKPPATAALVIMNLNLNCAFPVSLPLGVVYAFNTVTAGMTLGDYLGGIAFMVVSGLIEYGVGKVLGGAAGSAATSRLITRMFMRAPGSAAREFTAFGRAVLWYLGPRVSPIIARLTTRRVGEAIVGGGAGIALDKTPLEDGEYTATNWLGRQIDSL